MPMQSKSSTPSPQQLQRSAALIELIRRNMQESHGMLSFEQFMQQCLYAEELGYYAQGESIFGAEGDFVTSPEISDLFARAFANHLCANRIHLQGYSLLEIGAGSGCFAAQLLTALKENDFLPQRYYILETSAGLRQAQQNFLQSKLKSEFDLVEWTQRFDEPINKAVVIANEVMDALPVRLVSIENQKVFERCVQWSKDQFVFVKTEADSKLQHAIKERIEDQNVWRLPNYNTEICSQLPNFIQQTASFVKEGMFFLVDYGYPRREYYHVQRAMGTLLCHFQHFAHDNPLHWPGLQDISCNVDFTAVAEAGLQAELELECYCTQTQFLLASNILQNIEQDLKVSSAFKQLTLPGEMGERFQVMVFSKQMTLDHDFATRDLSHRL